jgi:N-acetyl sugar amidotransferase
LENFKAKTNGNSGYLMNKINKYNTYYGLPNEVTFCSKCVISNQRPNSVVEFKNKASDDKEVINIGEDGICSACHYNEIKNEIDWKDREYQLIELCKKIKKESKSYYDCIVPGSGGKDSAYTAHILKYKYGLNPLTVTWAPHLYTDIGWKNFQNWSHEGGLDNILFTPNGKLHRILTKLAFVNLCHPFQPFIIGQRIIGPKIANKFGVKYVFYGENQAEYGNDINDNKKETMDKKFFLEEKKIDILYGGISKKEIIKNYNFEDCDFTPYEPLTEDKNLTEVHYLGYYLKWDPQECYYYASKNTGFKANIERTEGSYSKYSSIDDKIDPFHYYTTLTKFGLGRASYDAAQEIRNDKIDRNEGINLVKLYDNEFPKKYFKEFLEYISITEDYFYEIIDKFRSPHLWAKDVNGDWKLRHNVSKTGLDD